MRYLHGATGFVSTFVYDLPFGRGKKYMNSIGRTANLVIGGWGVTGMTLAQSGESSPRTLRAASSILQGTFPTSRSVSTQRPDCVAGNTGILSNPPNADYLDQSAFTIPASNIGRFRKLRDGYIAGPGTVI